VTNVRHEATKTNPTGQEILDLPMPDNDAEAATLREYFARLAEVMWDWGSVKRPFGNSGWADEVGGVLARAGYLWYEEDSEDEYDYIENYDSAECERLVRLALVRLRTP
jgi:hypothetical protein